MRVGIDAVPFALESAGIARYLSSVLTELQQLDTDTEFLLYTPVPINVPLVRGNWRVRMAPGRLRVWPSLWAQLTLPGLLAADGVDAFWGQPTNMPIRLLQKCFRLLTLHDLVPYVCPESMKVRSWLRMRTLLRPVATAADVVIADSKSTADLGRRYLGLDGRKIRVVYAASPSFMQPVPKAEARATVAREFGINREYVLCVSTIEPRKDHLTLLSAVASLPQAPLVVLAGGVGWRCGGILAEICEQERIGRVRFVGRVDDRWLSTLYSGAKLSVYPSLYEGFGLPVLEAMACGCPVVCSDSSSLPEVGGRAAAYFRTGDSRDLSQTLASLLPNQHRLELMSSAGLAHAQRFSFRRAAEEISAIIQEGVLARG